MSLNWAAAGLAYDIVGVMVLGAAIAATSEKVALSQSRTYWDQNKLLYHALLMQRFDARWGLAFMVAGFVMQMLSALQVPNHNFCIQISTAALVPLSVIFLISRHQAHKKKIQGLEIDPDPKLNQ